MSWVDDEAQKSRSREELEQQQAYTLRYSNYWAKLLQQIQADITAINKNPHWQRKLGGFPVSFEEVSGEPGHEICKQGIPDVSVRIINRGRTIEVKRWFYDNPLSLMPEFKSWEELRVDTSGDKIVLLTTENTPLIMPEQASRYILKVVIKSLDISSDGDS